MVSSSRKLFIDLLRCALWGRDFDLAHFDGEDVIPWGEILTMAQNQSVLGLMFAVISELPREKQPSAESFKRLYGVAVRTRQTHALHRSVIARIVSYFASGGVGCDNVVLLKGEAVASLYPDPMLRTCGDIDLWVDGEHYALALRLLREMGSEMHERGAMEKHDTVIVDGVTVELHDHIVGGLAQLRQRKRFEEWTLDLTRRENLESAEIEDAKFSVLSGELGVVYLFLHGWQHLESDGVGFRQLCDWVLVLDRDAELVDWSSVHRKLKQFGLLRAWYLFERLGVELLGLDCNKAPFWRENDLVIPQSLLEKIFVGGNFGFYGDTFSKNESGSWGGKFHSIQKIYRCSKVLWRLDKRYALEYFLVSLRSGLVRLVWRKDVD